jgi:hypothetical protein
MMHEPKIAFLIKRLCIRSWKAAVELLLKTVLLTLNPLLTRILLRGMNRDNRMIQESMMMMLLMIGKTLQGVRIKTAYQIQQKAT